MAVSDFAELDPDLVREQFPALEQLRDGRPVVYLDGPGGSQVPRSVADAVTRYLLEHNANSDGPFATSMATDRLLTRARESGGDLLGCEPEEVVFGANATTINFLLAHAFARTLAPGDEIVVTELDHDANVSPWLLVARDHQLTVRTARLEPLDGTLPVDAVRGMVGPRTRVVACTLASNALGTVPDMAAIAQVAHEAGALIWADGVHFAPHRLPRFRELGLDVLLTSPYKYFGPHLGVAAVRGELARAWPADRVRPAAEEPAGHRFETGTQSHEAIAGFVAAVEYLESLGAPGSEAGAGSRRARLELAYGRIEAHERALTARTLARMREIRGLTMYGIADPDRAGERTPTFCLNLEGWRPGELSRALADRGLYTYDGNYYALGAMDALGLESGGGALRAGFLHYTTEQDAERLCAELEQLAGKRPT